MRGRKIPAAGRARGDGELPLLPEIPLWFKVGFWIQFSLNIIFLVVAFVTIGKIGEFWAVDSRNLWRQIDRLDARIEEMHGTSEIPSLNSPAAEAFTDQQGEPSDGPGS